MTPRQTSAAAVRSSMTVPPDLVMGLLGSADENLLALESCLSAEVHARGNAFTISGSAADVALAERVISELIAILAGGQALSPDSVRRSVAMVSGRDNTSPAEVLTLDILSRRGKTIRPKTLNQKRYVDAIDTNTIVFGIGPAGTGKTYLAMAKAVQALQTKQVTRIILTRPAVDPVSDWAFCPEPSARRSTRICADALRRAARHDGCRGHPETDGSRGDRGCAAGLYAGP